MQLVKKIKRDHATTITKVNGCVKLIKHIVWLSISFLHTNYVHFYRKNDSDGQHCVKSVLYFAYL